MKKSTLVLMILMVVSMTLSACGGSTDTVKEKASTDVAEVSQDEDTALKSDKDEEKSEDEIDDTSYEESPSTDETWAIYWYLCGGESESNYGIATDKLEAMQQVSLPENVKVIIETGGATAWQNDFVDPNVLQRYVYSGDELTLVDEQEQVDMGEASTLEDFLTFCMDNYSADHKMLLFGNLGGESFADPMSALDRTYDGISYGELSCEEMMSAIKGVRSDVAIPKWLDENNPSEEELGDLDLHTFASQNMPNMFDLVGFDSNYRASLEYARVFYAPYGSYMVASQGQVMGLDYTGWLGALADDPSMDGEQLGTVICDTYMDNCKELGTDDEVTLSVIDLEKVSQLGVDFDLVGEELLKDAVDSIEVGYEFAGCADQLKNSGENNDTDGYSNRVDLGNLIENAQPLIPNTSQQLLSDLQDVVVYKVSGANYENAAGLSVFYFYDEESSSIDRYYNTIKSSLSYSYFLRYLMDGEVPEGAKMILDGSN